MTQSRIKDPFDMVRKRQLIITVLYVCSLAFAFNVLSDEESDQTTQSIFDELPDEGCTVEEDRLNTIDETIAKLSSDQTGDDEELQKFLKKQLNNDEFTCVLLVSSQLVEHAQILLNKVVIIREANGEQFGAAPKMGSEEMPVLEETVVDAPTSIPLMDKKGPYVPVEMDPRRDNVDKDFNNDSQRALKSDSSDSK